MKWRESTVNWRNEERGRVFMSKAFSLRVIAYLTADPFILFPFFALLAACLLISKRRM
jgi:hypothetical protein